MEQSIEQLWKNGFLREGEINIPRINQLYTLKSQALIERFFNQMARANQIVLIQSFLLFPMGMWLGKHWIWGLICFATSLPWYFTSRYQIKSLKQINYAENCYDYLLSIRKKNRQIAHFNHRLSVYSVFIIMTLMLIYTYINQYGKTIGEIFGLTGLNWPTWTIFGLIPISTLIAYFIYGYMARRKSPISIKLDELLEDMEALKMDR